MIKPSSLTIAAALFLGLLQSAPAEKVEKREEVRESKTVSSSNSISSSTANDKGTVTYNDKEVWKGKVKKGLTTIAKSVDEENLAAAWDGRKLVWENVNGAGKKLEPDLKKALKQQEKLKKGLPIPPA